MKKRIWVIAIIAIVLILCGIVGKQVINNYNQSDIKIMYNTKQMNFSDVGYIEENKNIYIALQDFSEQLHYDVDLNSDLNLESEFIRIHDNLTDIHVYGNGVIKVNGNDYTSEFELLNSKGVTYVPLSFIEDNFNVSVKYKPTTKMVKMTGRDIYSIENHVLTSYTKRGKKSVCQINNEENPSEPTIVRVNRTKYSDIVDTLYFGTGGITSDETNQIYVRDGEMIFNTEYKSEIEATARRLDAGVRYYDDRVAFITKKVIDETYCYLIKIYDDKTGELIETINTTKEYNSVLNIQGIGENFLVVNMIEDDENDENFSKGIANPQSFMTTVIELDTGKVTPIYKQLKNKDIYLTNAMNSVSFIPYGIPPSDGIILDNRDGNKLNFVCFPNYDDEVKYQYTLGE